MEVFEAVKTLLAVRAYQDKPIPPEIVQRIAESAHLTASSRNGQPWHFVVVQDPATLKRLGELAKTGPYTAQAPLAIAVAMEDSQYNVSDASRAIQSMMLTAWSEGIGGPDARGKQTRDASRYQRWTKEHAAIGKYGGAKKYAKEIYRDAVSAY